MRKILAYKFAVPFYFFLPALLLHDLAPVPFQSAGWQLLNLAIAESALRGDGEVVPKLNRIIIYTLRALWGVKVLLVLRDIY
jgi:hypothetical protein